MADYGVFSRKDAGRIRSAVRIVERSTAQGGGPGTGFGTLVGTMAATVRAVSGTSHSARYKIEADHDPNLILLNALPICRPVSADVTLVRGEVGDPATILWRRQSDGTHNWSLLRVLTEVPAVAACNSNATVGLGQSGVTNAVHPVRNAWLIQAMLYVTAFSKSVTSGTQTKLSQALYTFPAGYIHFLNGLTGINAKASAVGLTNNIRVGLGTTAASGSGTTLTAAESNVMASATLGPLSTSGVQGRSPLDGNVNADGTSSARVLYLNVCPTANWTATASITFDRHTAMSELMNFQWRNMNGIS